MSHKNDRRSYPCRQRHIDMDMFFINLYLGYIMKVGVRKITGKIHSDVINRCAASSSYAVRVGNKSEFNKPEQPQLHKRDLLAITYIVMRYDHI